MKLLDILGLPVLETESGTQIGEVQEAVLNLAKASVCGLAVSGPTWFSQERGILFLDLSGIGRDAVIVGSAAVVQDFAVFADKPDIHRFRDIRDKQIYTETGLCLGTLVDIFFDQLTGEIRFYEVSDGFVTDFLHGRMVMPLPQAQVIQGERLIVPEVMAKLLSDSNQEPGGA
ncbi:MAG: PRC-barrel domain-containing protein [Negativicutes bacterium]|nr:PRC-barrel domain-containing protein [Negativicutes bacterium]